MAIDTKFHRGLTSHTFHITQCHVISPIVDLGKMENGPKCKIFERVQSKGERKRNKKDRWS